MGARPKTPVIRSEDYRRFVSGYPCACCGIEGYTQVAHANQLKWGKAKGRKSCDTATFPLCGPRPGHIGCHQMHDLKIDISREEANANEDRWVETMRVYAARDGWRF